MKLKGMNCPNCGAKLEIKEQCDFIICEYCGTEIAIDKEDEISENSAVHVETDFEKKTLVKKKILPGIMCTAFLTGGIVCGIIIGRNPETKITDNSQPVSETTAMYSETSSAETVGMYSELSSEETAAIYSEASSEESTEVDSLYMPDDEYVISCLKTIPTITDIEAVTEYHDPNGQLGKQGGYVGCVYFTDTQVDRASLYLENENALPVDVGCNGGGAIEIFRTVEDAKRRDTYLAAFDGGALSSGSHRVYGTVLVRTSAYLTASEQNQLTEDIVAALTR